MEKKPLYILTLLIVLLSCILNKSPCSPFCMGPTNYVAGPGAGPCAEKQKYNDGQGKQTALVKFAFPRGDDIIAIVIRSTKERYRILL